jgi:IS30 family transposase
VNPATGRGPDYGSQSFLRDRNPRRTANENGSAGAPFKLGSDTLRDALIARMADPPSRLIRSITRDQGTEMVRYKCITAALRPPVYFYESHSPWHRGTNEIINGPLRDYFLKRTDLSVHRPITSRQSRTN